MGLGGNRMKEPMNLLEQLHQQVNLCFGHKASNEYFCMLQRAKPLDVKQLVYHGQKPMQVKILENELLNVTCPPYHIMDRLLPSTLANRWKLTLSMWCAKSDASFITLDQKQQQNWDRWVHVLELEMRQPISESAARFQSLLEQRLSDLLAYSYQAAIGEAELQEAQQLLKEMKCCLPDHQAIYPILCRPADWAKSCFTAFQKQDVLRSFAYLFKKLEKLTDVLKRQIEHLLLFEHEADEAITNLMCTYRTFQKACATLPLTEDTQKQRLALITMAFAYDAIVLEQVWKHMTEMDASFLEKDTMMQMLTLLQEPCKSFLEALRYVCTHPPMQEPYVSLTQSLQQILKKWQDCKKELHLSNRRGKDAQCSLLPSGNAHDFEAVSIDAPFLSLLEPLQRIKAEKEQNCKGLTAFFVQRIPYGISEDDLRSLRVEATFLARRVEIEYPWFQADVFQLSKYFLRYRDHPLSMGHHKLSRIGKHELLPSYPSAFVVAKDITLRLHFPDANTALPKLIKRHIRQGKSLLCFPLQEPTMIDISGKTMTIRCLGACLLGYFLRFTPKDQSKKMKEERI